LAAIFIFAKSVERGAMRRLRACWSLYRSALAEKNRGNGGDYHHFDLREHGRV